MSNNFKMLSSAKISDKRNLVISKHSSGGYTLAQQIQVEEDGNVYQMFLKNTVQVKDKEYLQELKEAIEKALNS